MADNGIPMPPVRRSATAILEIRTLEGLCRSSFFFFTAKIVNVFKRNAMGAAIVATQQKSKEKWFHVGRTLYLVRVSCNKALSYWYYW